MVTKKRKAKKRAKTGRRTLYKAEYAVEAASFSLGGLTIEEMAEQWGVNPDTVYEWQKRHPEFSDAIKANRDRADMPIVDAARKRAAGYVYQKAIPFKVRRVEYADGKRLLETEEVVTVYVDEHVPPDTNAFKFWLTNRQNKHWREKTETMHSFDADEIAAMTDKAALLAIVRGGK